MSDRATSGGARPLGVSATVDDVDVDRETIVLPVGPSDIDRVATLATTAQHVLLDANCPVTFVRDT